VSADPRPAETAAYEHRLAVEQLAVEQMTGPGGHAAAVMAPFPGISVTDRAGTGPVAVDLPPVPDAESRHTGGSGAGHPA
jgi:hypothetical protein